MSGFKPPVYAVADAPAETEPKPAPFTPPVYALPEGSALPAVPDVQTPEQYNRVLRSTDAPALPATPTLESPNTAAEAFNMNLTNDVAFGQGPRLLAAREAVKAKLDGRGDLGATYDQALPVYRAYWDRLNNDHPYASFGGHVTAGVLQGAATGGGVGANLAVNTAQGLGHSRSEDASGQLTDALAGGTIGLLAGKYPIPVAATALGAGLFGDRLGLSDGESTQMMLGGGLGLGMALPTAASRLMGRVVDPLTEKAEEAVVNGTRQRNPKTGREDIKYAGLLDQDEAEARAADRSANQIIRGDASEDRAARSSVKDAVSSARASETEALRSSEFEAQRAAQAQAVEAELKAAHADRSARTEAAKAEHAQRVSDLEAKVRELASLEERATQTAAVKEHDAKHRSAWDEYMARLKAEGQALLGVNRAKEQHQGQVKSHEQALADLEEARAAAKRSADGAYAQAVQSDYNADHLMGDVRGLSDEANARRAALQMDKQAWGERRFGPGAPTPDDRYNETLESKLRAVAARESRLFQEAPAPFDETAARAEVQKRLDPRSLVPKETAYGWAQELGLAPGDLSTFTPVPEQPYPLATPRPVEPPPAPSKFAAQREKLMGEIALLRSSPPGDMPPAAREQKLQERLAALRNLQSQEPLGPEKPAYAYLRDAPPDVRTAAQSFPEYANPNGPAPEPRPSVGGRLAEFEGAEFTPVPERKEAAIAQAGSDLKRNMKLAAGTGLGAATIAGAVGGPNTALAAGTLLGGSGAAAAVTRALTKDPASQAFVLRKVSARLATLPNLSAKYGAAIKQGLTLPQVVFYAQQDPEFASVVLQESGQ